MGPTTTSTAATSGPPSTAGPERRPRSAPPAPPARPGPPLTHERLPFVVGPSIVLLVALALPGLLGRDMWLDEGFSMAAAKHPWASITREHGTMGLYYAILGAWSRVSMATWWVRSLSLLFMASALVALATLLRRQWGPSVARWGCLFAAASFLVVRLAGEARSYALVLLLVTGTWAALDHAVEAPDRTDWWRWYWLGCALIPLAHGVALLQVGAQFLAVLAARPGRTALKRAIVGPVLAVGVFGALLLGGISAEGNWVTRLTVADAVTLLESLTHPDPGLALLVGIAVLVGAVRCTRDGLRADGPLDRFRSQMYVSWGLATVAMVVVASLVRPLQVPRYTAASAFGLAGLLAVGLRRKVGSTRLPIVAAVILALLVSAGAMGGAAGEPTWTTAAGIVRSGLEPGDVLAFPNPDSRLPFEAAWRQGRPSPAPAIGGDRSGLGTFDRFGAEFDQRRLARSLAAGDRVWVVAQPQAGVADKLDDFLANPTIRRTFRIASNRTIADDIHVVLLVARHSPG